MKSRGNVWDDANWELLTQLKGQFEKFKPQEPKPRFENSNQAKLKPKKPKERNFGVHVRNYVKAPAGVKKKSSSSSGCPLCKEPISNDAMDEHYKTKHAFEFYQVQELERLKQKSERLRPQIFLGGSPGSGRKR